MDFKIFFRFVGILSPFPFWKDKRFWGALFLGPLGCEGLKFFLPIKTNLFPLSLSFLFKHFLFVAFPEEFFFRGFLLPFIAEKFSFSWYGISAANILTALIFALLHLLTHPPLWALGTFFPSLVFGYFRERHHSLWPSVILHYFYNLSYFFILA